MFFTKIQTSKHFLPLTGGDSGLLGMSNGVCEGDSGLLGMSQGFARRFSETTVGLTRNKVWWKMF